MWKKINKIDFFYSIFTLLAGFFFWITGWYSATITEWWFLGLVSFTSLACFASFICFFNRSMFRYFASPGYFEWEYSFKRKFFYSWWRPIENFFAWGIKSIQYSLFLWKDRDFDWSYILLLLQYKLKRTREHIVKHDNFVRAVETGEEIEKAEKWIRRILDNDYLSDEFDAHTEKWGETEFITEKLDNGNYRFICISKEKAVKNNQVEEEKKEYDILIEKFSAAKRKDWEEFWEYAKNNTKNWWD